MILKKAGKPGWLSLIPIYNGYALLNVISLPGWWAILLAGWFMVRNLVLWAFGAQHMPVGLQIVFSFGWETMPLWYFVAMEVSRSFGKSRWFAMGLFLLPPVFYGILAFGRAEYGQDTGRAFTYPGRTIMTVFNRELQSYFTTPLAYVFLVIFLFFSGYLTFKQGFYEMRQADMRAFFMNLPLLFVFMVPSTAMRMWAEERKVGSIELLFTLPITITQAVLGKFLAAWLFLVIALALTFPMVITISYLGKPDVGLIITGYLGSVLMAGGFLAIGCFFSAVSKNQVISFVLSVVACAVLVFAGMPSTLSYFSTFLPAGMVSAIESMSFQRHFESIQRGVLKFGDLSYFVLLIVGWIAACSIVLDERKAK